MAEKLFLIDGSNHAFRVFFALPRMTANGRNTGALLGFANMLRKLEKELLPDYVIVVFDRGKSFRVDLYPDYKGHRPEMPEELREQWPQFPDLVEAWGYRCLAMEGFEADDVIGTLAKRWAGPDLHVSIVSGDKDFYQLVGDHISILDIMKDKVVAAEGVVEKFGVGPDRVIDVLALAGDASDNVPGVSGIGAKTATQLVNDFGSLEGLLERADEVKGKRGEKLRAEADIARLSRTLVTIRTDVELELTLDDLREHPREVERLRELFVQWQFRTHLNELDQGEDAPPPAIDRSQYRTIDSVETLAKTVRAIREAGKVSVDLETTSLDVLTAKLVGICLCWSEDDAVYIPVGHIDADGNRVPGQLSEDEAMEELQPLLEDPTLPKIGQNLKYDLSVLRARGYTLEGIASDTMLADYLLEPDRTRHKLDDLALRYLGHRMIAYEEATKGIEDGNFARVSIADATQYGAEDAHVVWLLHHILIERLETDDLKKIFDEIEVPLIPILSAMELEGIGIDLPKLALLSDEFADRIAGIEADIFKLAGRSFTINSTKQLQQVLFEERGLTPVKKTKTGFSTDADTLEQLAAIDPLPAQILAYRSLAKLKSTYVDALPRVVSAKTNRIHTSFHQAVAATGRLSSNDPNLQNIPVRAEDGRRIRECFVAKPDHVFLSCDYSQVELRLLAHYCGDGPLLEAFHAGQDIHQRTASEVFGLPMDAVTADQRSAAKAINFGIVYGMSAFRLAHNLRITRREAQDYMDGYFARYSQVKRVHEELIENAREKGYAETLWGRRRRIPDIRSSNQRDRGQAERIALNTPLQGSAADLIKLAMAAVDARIRADALPCKVLLQVHDELLLEVPADQVERVAESIRGEMETAATLRVPLRVEAAWADNWADAH